MVGGKDKRSSKSTDTVSTSSVHTRSGSQQRQEQRAKRKCKGKWKPRQRKENLGDQNNDPLCASVAAVRRLYKMPSFGQTNVELEGVSICRTMSSDDGSVKEPNVLLPLKKRLRKHYRALSADLEYAAKVTRSCAKKTIEKSTKMFELLSIENVYLWQNDNPYLLNRHRPVLNDFRLCFLSVFKLHTETFNIWTHLIGSLIMICLWIYFSIEIKNIDMADVAQMHLFFLFSTLCMGLSSLFHIVSCHSEPLKILYNKLDYVGILLMIAGSSIPVQHFMFYCRPGIRNCYLLINVVLCMVLIKFVMNPEFQDPKKLRKRGILFVSFGFFSILPLAHSSLLSYNQHVTVGSVKRIIVMGSIYIFGVLLYSFQLPERFCPGKFDIFFQSHQLMHICVLIGALIHHTTLKNILLMGLKC